MSVFRIEVHEIREDEWRVRLLHQIDRLAHAVGVRFGADLTVDADAIEDVGDFTECDDLPAGLLGPLDDRLASWPDGEVLPVRRSLEMAAARSDKWPRDDASDVVFAAHDLARDRADSPQLFDRDDLFVRRNLEYRVCGRVDDRKSGPHVLFAELVEDHRT